MSFSISNFTKTFPAFLSSGETISPVLAISTANEQSVGGTSISLNEPDILSLPPIEGRPSFICASYAPKSAAIGSPQRFGSSPSLLKYSWNVNLILL